VTLAGSDMTLKKAVVFREYNGIFYSQVLIIQPRRIQQKRQAEPIKQGSEFRLRVLRRGVILWTLMGASMQLRGGDWVCDSYTHIVYILKRTKVVKTYLLVEG
jgi:hypothetical protein